MPTLALQGPYRFFFYSREPGEPPHVHVRAGRATAKIWLGSLGVAKFKHFNDREIAAIVRIVRERREEFLDGWHGHFGTRPD